ncbi:hypothetical protein GCM10011375_07160 [Hymenobacter qilianensis]|uniref:Uncharacterized protein n=2 Tax=Hymenobacter qilianensis TaxID=1385715 RepID=A0ACB5PMW2_9BACT|nr:DUF2750 domain-containing protein [Hymenobacter qilianensis]QNP53642.1 DUF2750 domain-containing protein [Hymenobacter qilianensis]GGF54309.1 hypothetical protein GCM10011375_07160 [Hymenobacter qilianensis]
MRNPNPKEIEAVSKLPAFKRYQHLIKHVADTEIVFVLVDEYGTCAMSEVEGKHLLAIWPAAAYAELNKVGEWSPYTVEPLALEHFMQQVVPEAANIGHLIDAFPMNDKTGFVVSSEELLRDLQAELSNY